MYRRFLVALLALSFLLSGDAHAQQACPVNAVYDNTWTSISTSFYDSNTLRNWEEWRHKFDCDIRNDEDAYRFSAILAEQAHDPYTRFVPPQKLEEQHQRVQSTAQQVTTQELPSEQPTTATPRNPVAYLRFDNFMQADTVDQVRAGMQSVAQADAVVLDVRQNFGGWVDQFLAISGIFIERGLVIQIRERAGGTPATPQYQLVRWYLTDSALEKRRVEANGGESVIETRTREPYQLRHRPLALLVDEGTASAAEMLSGAVSQNPNEDVTTFGTTTYGKGVGQLYYEFPATRAGVSVTSLHYYSPRGQWYGDGYSERHGLVPVFPAPNTTETAGFGSPADEPLNRANEFLGRRLAASHFSRHLLYALVTPKRKQTEGKRNGTRHTRGRVPFLVETTLGPVCISP